MLVLNNEASKVFEKVNTDIYSDPLTASKAVAREIADLIIAKQEAGENCVLGLATGSTPKQVYAELGRLHREEGLSFKNVVSFNLDEYYPMQPDSIQSYVRFMKEQLFNHVDIAEENWNVPDGTLSEDEIAAYCDEYEAKIDSYGGLDLQILGIGGNGHIGFNESGSLKNSKTRMIALDSITRINAAPDFDGLKNTPRKAVTMGVQKIYEAKRVILMAWGEKKAGIMQKAVEGPMISDVPASYLQDHPNTSFVVDYAASTELKRVKTPWLLESIEWDDETARKAVVRLALKLDKPILQLTDHDYNTNGMNDLLAKNDGSAYQTNLKIFTQLQNTITGWPGGKPNVDDSTRPERATPEKKTVLIFSPHPDDDIISMGGTFLRLVEQGHDVHVAYQTSGNIAVADEEAYRFIDFANDFNLSLGFDTKDSANVLEEAKSFLTNKKPGDVDSVAVRTVKGIMREGEAKATCRFVGIPDANAHFQKLPFYETGTIKKNPMGAEDVQLTVDLIKEIKPHQIFAAGDLADPHGTHKVCLDVIFAALEELKAESFMEDCWVWLYRGAWHEWPVEEIEMAVPMSPEEVLKKRFGIFKHQSQKDGVVFQGSDSREFWQRAEERNADTANIYNALGFTEYSAVEAFRRYRFLDKK
ncbi:MAG: glucosamine-6-phosphate deaminase [Cytophagales bacterium]|nr:glucosamine-6-phosphate deaminase [Cytophagales bacterium]